MSLEISYFFNLPIDFAAAEILKNMDESFKACDDFYSFACNGYIKNAKPITTEKGELPAGQGLLIESIHEMESTTKKIVRSEIDIPGNISMARDIYNNCKKLCKCKIIVYSNQRQVNLDLRFSLRLAKFSMNDTTSLIYEMIDEMNIGWLSKSIRNETFDEKIDFVEITHKLRELGFNFRLLLGLYVTPRSDDDRRNILEVCLFTD